MSTLTTKLELKVMEGTDNLANTFQQGNYNANRLETLFGENLEDYQNLGTLTTRMKPLMRPTKCPDIPVSLERNTEVFRHHFL